MATTDIPVLPEELLQRIVSEFGDYGHTADGHYVIHQRTLVALALTNKQFHRLAQPLLYRSIYPGTYGRPWALQLLRTLVKKPKLADLVRNVWIEACIFEPEQPPETLEEGDPELFEAAAQQLRKVFDHNLFSERLLESLKEGDGGACMALLLLLAKGINFLHLEIPYEWDQTLLKEIPEAVARLIHDRASTEARPAMLEKVLPSLKSIEVEHWDTEGSANLGRLQYLVRLSSLESLRGHMLDITERNMQSFGTWPCNLRKMDTSYSLVDGSGLDRLLLACPKLEELTIEWGSAVVGDECDISWPEIGDALRQNGRSLKILALDPREAFFFHIQDWNPHPPLGDLRPLRSLEELRVPCMCLIGEDDEDDDGFPHFQIPELASILPDSLEKLEVLSWQEKRQEEDFSELSRQLVGLMAHARFRALSDIKFKQSQPILKDFEDAAWRRSLTGPDRVSFQRMPEK